MTQNGRNRHYTVAELFCGCGGFSHGFARSNRFTVLLGNDIKPAALRTFRYNHASERDAPEVLEGDIRTINIDTILATLERRGIREGGLDCLIGGPPCQGFSQLRRSEERRDSVIVRFKGYDKLDQDPRNDLVLRFLEVAAALRPKVIVIENVPQMLRHNHNGVPGGITAQVEATLLNELGYDVTVRKLNAADYGVPQLRERIFFIASRIGPISFPEPTHADPERRELLSLGSRPWVTVKEAISDLPIPLPGPHNELGGGAIELYPHAELSDYAGQMRSTRSFPYNHVTRRYGNSVLRIIREMQPGETWDHASERMRNYYAQTIAEHQAPDEDAEQAVARLNKQGVIAGAFFKRYYWSAYTRLTWDRPALTITANANFLGSGRFTHPEQDRGITMREAARLQGFDDDFRFITSTTDDNDTTTIGTGIDMIGEAVPSLLAEAIARHIAKHLDKHARYTQTEQPLLPALETA